MQEPQPLASELQLHAGYAGEIATGPVDARDKPLLDRVVPAPENDRKSRGGTCRANPRGVGRDYNIDATANEIGHQLRQPIELVFRPTVFDDDILALET